MAINLYRDPLVLDLLQRALHEDLGSLGDITVDSLVPPEAGLCGRLCAKQAGVVCGLPAFRQVCELVAPGSVRVELCLKDGTPVAAGQEVLRCRGSAATILVAERTALNLAQRLSGVATRAAACARAVAGSRAKVYDTRKTTPGLRRLEKHAVVCGGCRNHRIGLYDQVLIKENHIALMAASGPAEAVRRCRETLGTQAIIEVEIERLDDLDPVIQAGADIVLCDNMGPEQLCEAVAIRGRRKVELEASGGITLDDLSRYAATGVDRISIGALTHSVPVLDLSLRCELL